MPEEKTRHRFGVLWNMLRLGCKGDGSGNLTAGSRFERPAAVNSLCVMQGLSGFDRSRGRMARNRKGRMTSELLGLMFVAAWRPRFPSIQKLGAT